MQLFAPLSTLLSGGSPIDLDGTALIQLVIFVLAFIILYALIFKPMVALFEAREEAIDGAQDEAKRLQGEVEAKREEFDREMNKVRSAAGEERDRLKAEGQQLERSLLEKVRTETEQVMGEARSRLDKEAGSARTQLTSATPALAREIATRVLGREVKA